MKIQKESEPIHTVKKTKPLEKKIEVKATTLEHASNEQTPVGGDNELNQPVAGDPST